MKRIAFGALVVVVAGCNGILGIESAAFTPEPTEAGLVEAGATDARPEDANTDAEPEDANTDAGSGPCINLDSNPRHCGVCGHDCAGGTCAAGKCQPYTVLTEPNAEYSAVAMDSDNVYVIETSTATIRRAPIGGGGTSTTMYTGNPDTGLIAMVAVMNGYVYFVDDPTAGNDTGAIARCPTTGCASTGPEKVVDPINGPNTFAIDPSGTIVFGTDGPSGTIYSCPLPPCHGGAYNGLVPNVAYLNQVVVSGSVIGWTELGPFSEGQSTVNTIVGTQRHTLDTGFTLAGLTMTTDHVYFYDASSSEILSATFDDPTSTMKVGATTVSTNLANDGSFVYWTDSTIGTVWSLSVAAGAAPSKVSGTQNSPTIVAADATSIVWLNNPSVGGVPSSVVRVVK